MIKEKLIDLDRESIPDDSKENIRKKYAVLQDKPGKPDGWREVKLGDMVRFQRGYDLPKSKMEKGDVPVAGSNGIIGYHNTATTRAPGITVGRSGNIGAAKLYKTDFWAHNTTLFVKDFFGNDEVFIFYLLQTIDLSGFNSGSAVPSLNRNYIHELDISVPQLHEQKAIAEVLSSLDDKIDLLHRQNKVLEDMAQTLFREWFVEDNGEGWEVFSLYDAIELVGGGTPSTSVPEYWDGEIGWVSGRDVAANHKGIIPSAEKSISVEGLKNSSAKLIPRHSTVISARGTVGKYGILSGPMAFSQSNYGIKPKFGDAYFFTYLLIDYSIDELLSAAYGSVFDTITTDTFKGHFVKLPAVNVIQEFEIEVTPLFEKMISNQSQIQILENLRNALLRKLMSGKVRMKYSNIRG